MRIDVSAPSNLDLRLPSGNELGANQTFEWNGKYYTTDDDGNEDWVDARMFHPSDFTIIDEIPPHLRVCWEFFKMCEPFLREFYEEEVKEEREEEENSEFLEATSLGGCGGM